MRDAMCADDHERAGLYFGARNGAVWGSADEGETWRQLVSDLPGRDGGPGRRDLSAGPSRRGAYPRREERMRP